MKNTLITLLLISTFTNAQIHHQDEDRFSIQMATEKNAISAGIEFQAEFSNGVYIRPQIHYVALKDGYLETSAGLGYNLTFNRWNYKAGIKLGVVNRAVTYPIFAVEGGLEYHITEKIGLGIRGSYDARADADYYGGKPWQYNSIGYIKFAL